VARGSFNTSYSWIDSNMPQTSPFLLFRNVATNRKASLHTGSYGNLRSWSNTWLIFLSIKRVFKKLSIEHQFTRQRINGITAMIFLSPSNSPCNFCRHQRCRELESNISSSWWCEDSRNSSQYKFIYCSGKWSNFTAAFAISIKSSSLYKLK